eukprot:CAMPEP_0172326934 /NCGR_PEP_ID=MMETSP1058-20130122/58052_1 /TAXON_ID=83371 /ORGANISM="Detonula confervacea, Strain CCMP 353" /LENGTH=412 /DNA_ID=CAMNT_0013043841 /DNA_START=167 /DNA_END=1405 /DNA_ORIENTATION=-
MTPNPRLPSTLGMMRQSSSLISHYTPFSKRRRSYSALQVATVEIEAPRNNIRGNSQTDGLLRWSDVIPISLYATACLVGAILISTYEDFDVTHTRPNPSTLRLPTSSSKGSNINFLGAATQGMGWGPSNRGIQSNTKNDIIFEEWYGTSATTLQWKPSYNEIMLEHRSERIPRWNELDGQSSIKAKSMMGILSNTKDNVLASKEELQYAVLQLYQSLDELDELKLMADDYMWDDMRALLNPSLSVEAKHKHSLQHATEYSMDILRSTPSYYASTPLSKYDSSSKINQNNSPNSYMRELPDLIGFDWGSCALRHCGAKADAQEAVAELYNNVGLFEPFECRFIIDIIERSIRDVLAVVPDDLKPHHNGVLMQVKTYERYVPQGGNNEGDEDLSLDNAYTQALSAVRVDLSMEE